MERIQLTFKMLWFTVQRGHVSNPPKFLELLKLRKQLQSSSPPKDLQSVVQTLGMTEKVQRYKAHTEQARQGRNVDEILDEMTQEGWEDSCRRMGTVVRFQIFLATAFALFFLVSPFYFGNKIPVLLFMWPVLLGSLTFFGGAFFLVWKARPNAEVRDFARDSLVAHQAGDVQAQQQILREFQGKVQVRVDALKK